MARGSGTAACRIANAAAPATRAAQNMAGKPQTSAIHPATTGAATRNGIRKSSETAVYIGTSACDGANSAHITFWLTANPVEPRPANTITAQMPFTEFDASASAAAIAKPVAATCRTRLCPCRSAILPSTGKLTTLAPTVIAAKRATSIPSSAPLTA